MDVTLLLCEYRRVMWEVPVSSPEQCEALLSLPRGWKIICSPKRKPAFSYAIP